MEYGNFNIIFKKPVSLSFDPTKWFNDPLDVTGYLLDVPYLQGDLSISTRCKWFNWQKHFPVNWIKSLIFWLTGNLGNLFHPIIHNTSFIWTWICLQLTKAMGSTIRSRRVRIWAIWFRKRSKSWRRTAVPALSFKSKTWSPLMNLASGSEQFSFSLFFQFSFLCFFLCWSSAPVVCHELYWKNCPCRASL